MGEIGANVAVDGHCSNGVQCEVEEVCLNRLREGSGGIGSETQKYAELVKRAGPRGARW